MLYPCRVCGRGAVITQPITSGTIVVCGPECRERFGEQFLERRRAESAELEETR